MSEWQDIVTAPQDGSEFQAWVIRPAMSGDVHAYPLEGWWEPRARIGPTGEHEQYDMEYGWESVIYQTFSHWMPQPGAPL